jgi:hypothetical protein
MPAEQWWPATAPGAWAGGCCRSPSVAAPPVPLPPPCKGVQAYPGVIMAPSHLHRSSSLGRGVRIWAVPRGGGWAIYRRLAGNWCPSRRAAPCRRRRRPSLPIPASTASSPLCQGARRPADVRGWGGVWGPLLACLAGTWHGPSPPICTPRLPCLICTCLMCPMMCATGAPVPALVEKRKQEHLRAWGKAVRGVTLVKQWRPASAPPPPTSAVDSFWSTVVAPVAHADAGHHW